MYTIIKEIKTKFNEYKENNPFHFFILQTTINWTAHHLFCALENLYSLWKAVHELCRFAIHVKYFNQHRGTPPS